MDISTGSKIGLTPDRNSGPPTTVPQAVGVAAAAAISNVPKDNAPVERDADGKPTAFKPEGFSDDIKQGDIGDCYFVGSMDAFLKNPNFGKQKLADMITPIQNADGSLKYKVVFPGYPDNPIEVEVSELSDKQLQGGLGNRILERAFGELTLQVDELQGKDKDKEEKSTAHIDEAFDSIGNGGLSANAFFAFTGQKTEPIPDDDTAKKDELMNKMKADPGRYVVATAIKLHQSDDLIKSREDKGIHDQNSQLVEFHIYTLKYDPVKETFILVNPWDTKNDTYELSQEDIEKYFNITAINDLKA